ncbi:MAG: hypothetical protein Q4F83_15095 [Eubacteriales bacterium]|nr:hypothetical protein [Eubacteriales bacterium]
MDKYEYQAKLEEINSLVEKEDYEGAARIADTIEWKRVRSVRTLCMVSEIYEAIGRAEDSKSILYRAYRRSPSSRQILYRLTEACVQTQDFDDAVEYYTEYVNLSPNDNSKYILKYEIYKGRGSSLEEQIGVLEELRSKEYTEQWAYELARLYDQAGMADKCVAECDDLALWFHNGKYVVQALELKRKYAPLTPEQQTVYDNPSEIVDMETKEEVVEKAVPTLGEVITKELPRSEKDVIADSIIMDTEKQIAAVVQASAPETSEKEAVRGQQNVPEVPAAEKKPVPQAPREFSTVELQSELANSMREILAGMRTAPSEEKLESIPEVLESAPEIFKRAEEVEEEQIPHQMSIDDLLTGTAEELKEETAASVEADEEADVIDNDVDALTAPTIDISKKIQQEMGGESRSIREFAASLNKKAAAETKTAKQEEVKPVETIAEAKPAEKAKTVVEAKPAAEEKAVAEVKPAAKEKAVTEAAEKAETAQEEEKAAETVPVKETAVQTPKQKTAAVNPDDYTRNGLDEKEKSMLGFWSMIRGMDEQINLAVTRVMQSVLTDKTSSKGNIVLVGDAGNGRTTLAISLAKIISRCKGQQVAKVAKIYAEDFNNKDIAATVSKMAGGVLIIEEAGDLNDNAVAQLSMAMDFKTDSLVIVLEDERRYLQDLLARNPQFAQKFDVTINVPMLTNDELVEFGKYYAAENGCTMEESAVSALYDGIAVMQTPEQLVAILDVKDIMDNAIRHANRFGIGKMFSSISGKRYDENDRVILKGKNFKKIK